MIQSSILAVSAEFFSKKWVSALPEGCEVGLGKIKVLKLWVNCQYYKLNKDCIRS
jgi:hypothetical protein